MRLSCVILGNLLNHREFLICKKKRGGDNINEKETIIKIRTICRFSLIQKPPLFLRDLMLLKLVTAFPCCSIDHSSQQRQPAELTGAIYLSRVKNSCALADLL